MKIPENEVLNALALTYSHEYDEYKRWEDAAKTLFHPVPVMVFPSITDRMSRPPLMRTVPPVTVRPMP